VVDEVDGALPPYKLVTGIRNPRRPPQRFFRLVAVTVLTRYFEADLRRRRLAAIRCGEKTLQGIGLL
jgi:hypothetical protein